MSDNLKQWLAPYRNQSSGNVAPMNFYRKLRAARGQAGINEWDNNSLRHSFGSYHLAKHRNVQALAIEMGNSPAMIFKHYRELVKPKDAERYWNIRPAAEENVVAMTA